MTLGDPRVTLCDSRVTLGDLRVTLGDTRVTLGDLRVTLGEPKVTQGLHSELNSIKYGLKKHNFHSILALTFQIRRITFENMDFYH